MLKHILKLENVQQLSKKEQLNIVGSQLVPGNGCSCFCYINNTKIGSSCTKLCSNGSVPGANPGGSNCGQPKQLE